MRVCLITAPIIAEFADPDEVTSHAVSQTVRDPQLGILSLAAMLQARGEAPRIVDLNKLYLEFALSIGQSKPASSPILQRVRLLQRRAMYMDLGSICSSYPLTIRIARTLKPCTPIQRSCSGDHRRRLSTSKLSKCFLL
jgi:hypothetical protein